MTDHDDIVDLLHRAVDDTPADDDQISRVAAVARRHRMVQRTAAAVAAAAVLAVGALVPWSRWDARPDRVDMVERPAAPADATPIWHDLPESPLDPRWGAFSWSSTGGLFVWGGYASVEGGTEGPRNDGAVLWDDTWTALPDSPLAPRMRMNSAAGWVEDVRRDGAAEREYWIVGGTGGDDGRTPLRDGAAYRPAGVGEGGWHELPTVPEPIAGGAVIDGSAMVVVAQGGDEGRPVYELLPGDGQWRAVEPSLPPADPAAVDNSDLHVLGVAGHLVVVGQGEMHLLADLPTGRNQDVDREWERIPAPDGAEAFGNIRGAVVDPARDAVVVLLSDGTYRYDLAAGEWSRIAGGLQPEPPQPIPLVRTDGGTLVAVDVVGGHVHALAEADGTWMALPPLDGSRVDAVVAAISSTVAGFDEGAGDPADVVDNLVVWGGMPGERRNAEALVLPLRQEAAIAQRGAEPDPAAVAGSYRAVVDYKDGTTQIFELVDGRVHGRQDPPYRTGPPTSWQGFGGGPVVSVDEQIQSGDATYIRARADGRDEAVWYRRTKPTWHEGLPATPVPRFAEGTRGFREVRDAEAGAQGLVRYSADIERAELDFLGWFSPLAGNAGTTHLPDTGADNANYWRGDGRIDIWVDAEGRVRRAEDVGCVVLGRTGCAEYEPRPRVVTRFDRFDALPPIAVPFDEGDAVTEAAQAGGITVVGCGDPAFDEPLRQRVAEGLDANGDIASHRIMDMPPPDLADGVARLHAERNGLFVAAARFRDGSDLDAGFRRARSLEAIVEGEPPRGSGWPSGPARGYAGVCAVESADWIELDR
jgi:hypothetical protein